MNTLAHKTSRRKQAYPVVIEHLTILCLRENFEKKTPNKCIVAVFALIELLKQLKREEYEQICQRDEFSHHLDSMQRIAQYFTEEARRNNIT